MKFRFIAFPILGAFALSGIFRHGQPPAVLRAHTSSMSGNWSADNSPYITTLDGMKKEFAKGKSVEDLLKKYKSIADNHPSDPVSQLAYIVAERAEIIVNHPGTPVPMSLVDDLIKNDPGNSYEYARHQFCMSDEADIQLPQKQIEMVGERLLEYNHQDNWVRLSLINLLSIYKTGPEHALPYALEWINREPNNVKAHSALGLIYFNMWAGGHKKNNSLAHKALAEYQAFMRLSPPSDGFRKFAEIYIEHLQSALAKRG